MCEAKACARGYVYIISIQLITWREGKAVHDTIDPVPMLSQVFEQRIDLLITGYIARKNQLRIPAGSKFDDSIVQLFTLVGKRELCSFSVHRFSNARGNRKFACNP